MPSVARGLLPYRCSGVPEYARCVNKLRKNVGLQTWIWRHIMTSQKRISSNSDHHTPLLNTRIWLGGIQSSIRPGHHQTSARHCPFPPHGYGSASARHWALCPGPRAFGGLALDTKTLLYFGALNWNRLNSFINTEKAFKKLYRFHF